MRILITGGTGSLGREICDQLIKHQSIFKIIVYSRDEAKHAKLQHPDIINVIGDVRDYDRLDHTISQYEPDFVIHAAALKRIDSMEFYPDECVKTNIIGSQNIVESCLRNKVKKAILISTDKACSPINVYGASKFIAERTFINADYRSGKNSTVFCCCRYGNVIGSRGSFIPLWVNHLQTGKEIQITSNECTRFLFSLADAADLVLRSLWLATGGEVFVPRLKSYRILDVLSAVQEVIGKETPVVEIGIRPGEKLHEDMINKDELVYTKHVQDMLCILPQYGHRFYNYEESYIGKPLNSANFITTDLNMIKSVVRNLI